MGKIKYSLEYDMKHSLPSMLWYHISTASGLAEWFADTVNVDKKQYAFHWNNVCQTAALVSMRSMVYVRFRWDDDQNASGTRTYFELRMSHNELTDTTMLTVTDFADDEADKEEMTSLWNQQIAALQHAMGV